MKKIKPQTNPLNIRRKSNRDTREKIQKNDTESTTMQQNISSPFVNDVQPQVKQMKKQKKTQEIQIATENTSPSIQNNNAPSNQKNSSHTYRRNKPKTLSKQLQKIQEKKQQTKQQRLNILIMGGISSGKHCLWQCYQSAGCPTNKQQNTNILQKHQIFFTITKNVQKKIQIPTTISIIKGKKHYGEHLQILDQIKKIQQSHMILICFSIKSQQSLNHAIGIKQLINLLKINSTIVLVGTQNDQSSDGENISVNQQDFGEGNYFLTSAKQNQNISELFEYVKNKSYQNLISKRPKIQVKQKTIQIIQQSSKIVENKIQQNISEIKPNKIPQINIVLVGDNDTGKTCLLQSYISDSYISSYCPNDKQPQIKTFTRQVKDKSNKIISIQKFYDIPGNLKIQQIKKQITKHIFNQNQKLDLIIINFSLISRKTLVNATEFRFKQIKKQFPGVPIVFIGNKQDKYNDDLEYIKQKVKNRQYSQFVKFCQIFKLNHYTSVDQQFNLSKIQNALQKYEYICQNKKFRLRCYIYPQDIDEQLIQQKMKKQAILPIRDIIDEVEVNKILNTKWIKCSALDGGHTFKQNLRNFINFSIKK